MASVAAACGSDGYCMGFSLLMQFQFAGNSMETGLHSVCRAQNQDVIRKKGQNPE